jgi:hypothetical protein
MSFASASAKNSMEVSVAHSFLRNSPATSRAGTFPIVQL